MTDPAEAERREVSATALVDWRDPATYAGLVEAGRPALAWELLRRESGYRAAVAGAPAGNIVPAASTAFTARWGLHFR